MTRNFQTTLALFTSLLFTFLQGTAAVAQNSGSEAAELDIQYAEHVPLAAHSLLLDVVRAGDRVIAAGERGHIVFSDDDGNSWHQAEAVPTRATLTRLFEIGGRMWAAGHDSVILTSGDQGNTWTRQYFDPDRQQPVMDLYFSNANTGIAVGAYGLMLRTSDGGQNWEDWAVNEEDDAHLNAVIGLPDGTLLIAGEAGFSYRSRDGGETWENLPVPYQGSMFGALLTEDSCVLFYGLRGHIMRSCDEGDSWEQLVSGTEATLMGAAEQDGEILLVGNSGAVLESDGSGGFAFHEHPSGVDLSAVLGLGGGKFLLVGEDGFYFYPEQDVAEVKP